MNSPDHRDNILNENFVDTGVAVVKGELKGKDTILVVQLFGEPFTEAEINILEQNQEQTATTISQTELLNNPQNIWQILTENRFMMAKALAIGIFTGLALSILANIINHYFKHRPKPLKRKLWGHLLFLIAFGILALLSYDGNIL